jgi:hypothetical protein
MAMFGMIVSGRLVSTAWEQAGPTNVVAEIQDADSVNHVVVFLTGAVPFPEGSWDTLGSGCCAGMGGAVYFCWPQPGGAGQVWQLLGVISNVKPSAIFRIGRLKRSASDENENMTNSFMELGQAPRHNAMVGISVEQLVVIEGQTPAAQVGLEHHEINHERNPSSPERGLECLELHGVQPEDAGEPFQLQLELRDDGSGHALAALGVLRPAHRPAAVVRHRSFKLPDRGS